MSFRRKDRRQNDNETGTRLPEALLEQITNKNYDDDERFAQPKGKKRKTQPTVSRKQRRKEERQTKKRKGSEKREERHEKNNDRNNRSHERTHDRIDERKHIEDSDNEGESDPLEQLRKLKEKKKAKAKEPKKDSEKKLKTKEDPLEQLRKLKQGKASSEVRIVKEDDLEDEEDEGNEDDFGSEGSDEELFDLGDFDEGEGEEVSDVGEDADDFEEFEGSDFGGFDGEDLENDSEDFDGSDVDGSGSSSELEETPDPIAELKRIKEKKKAKEHKLSVPVIPLRDDDDMEFYAKKLGLKNGKKSKLTKEDDDDLLGGLLDGLDFDYLDGEKESEEEDFDESEFESDSESFSKPKENPYVAPVDDSHTSEVDEDEPVPAKYVPPALRRKLALESEQISPEILALQKAIKGPLNKLSEANIGLIVNEINGLYLSNPRSAVNENLVSIVLESIVQQGRLLDTFVYLHACLVVAIYRLQGADFGAYFIQTLVERFEKNYKDKQTGKEVSNIISLLSSVHIFQLVSSRLLYDIIRKLIEEFSENNAELLVRLIRNSGNQMRSDDPASLKEIVLLTNRKASSSNLSTRGHFLVETITSLKNNKLKINNEASHQLSIRLKKFLSSLNNNKFNEPIQVTLADIENIELRGKWWLVGSAWKGHEAKEVTFNEEAVNDVLDNAEPNWMELARVQRMNTDIRRAIFVSIMSATDYVDAMTKLDKLALKKVQEREIPRVLVHCTGVEPAWNPYYGVLASKLCDSHSYRKTFQFMLWDILKDFEGTKEEDDFLGFDEDEDDDAKLKRVLNLGRFFGFMLGEGSLPLHALKNVNFLTASSDSKLFLEVLFITFFDQIGKKSQVDAVGIAAKSKKELKFDDKLLIERVMKAREQTALLRGLQYFLGDNILKSEIVKGRKQAKRVEWGVSGVLDVVDELLRESEMR